MQNGLSIPFHYSLSPSLHLYLKSVQEVSSKLNSENETPLFFSDTWSPTITSWPVTVKHLCYVHVFSFIYIYIFIFIGVLKSNAQLEGMLIDSENPGLIK